VAQPFVDAPAGFATITFRCPEQQRYAGREARRESDPLPGTSPLSRYPRGPSRPQNNGLHQNSDKRAPAQHRQQGVAGGPIRELNTRDAGGYPDGAKQER
jgi:hypothetical protein